MMNVTLIFPDVMVVIQRLDDDWGGQTLAPILLQSCSTGRGNLPKFGQPWGVREMGIPTTPGCVILLG